MLIVISPAKTLDFDTAPTTGQSSQVVFQEDADYLVNKLQKLSVRQLKKLMSISSNLAELNAERFTHWNSPMSLSRTKQAVLAFQGDVYLGLEAETFSEEDFSFAQDHLRILSGLYGILRPLDRIQPYRLEMGTSLKVTAKKNNLYKYWGDRVTEVLNQMLAESNQEILVNLASHEYFHVLKPTLIKARIITPVFKDWKNGQYKVISFFAKKARGLMSSYILRNQITEPEEIKGFVTGGYAFNSELSKGDTWVFTREEA